jgi:uncharacterized protein YjbI with pentapeptide repeats
VTAWNAWREKNRDIRPDLSEADLGKGNLARENFVGERFAGANLVGANLREADLRGTKFGAANLHRVARASWPSSSSALMRASCISSSRSQNS